MSDCLCPHCHHAITLEEALAMLEKSGLDPDMVCRMAQAWAQSKRVKKIVLSPLDSLRRGIGR